MINFLEIADELFPELREEYEAIGLSLDQICRAHRRLACDTANKHTIKAAVTYFNDQNRKVVPQPLFGLRESTEDSRIEAFLKNFRNGVIFLSIAEMGASLLIVKVDAGRGFFGGQRFDWVCYLGMGGDSYQPAGTSPSLAHAIMRMDALYRVFDKVLDAVETSATAMTSVEDEVSPTMELTELSRRIDAMAAKHGLK